MTNGDRIRQMTDEEMANYAAENFDCNGLITEEECVKHRGDDGRYDCERCWLDWLKQEVNDGD